jgi:hypothetical protein
MAFRFVVASLAVIAVAGPALAADPVRTGPAPAGRAGVNVESSNRDHIDQDAQFKTKQAPASGGTGAVGATGGITLNTSGALKQNGGTTTNNAGGTITNNGTINDRR